MFSTILRKGRSWNIRGKKINLSKGLIYIHDYTNPDIVDNGSELNKECNLSDVQKATWIKTKKITSTSLLRTFKEKESSKFIEFPGEQAKN